MACCYTLKAFMCLTHWKTHIQDGDCFIKKLRYFKISHVQNAADMSCLFWKGLTVLVQKLNFNYLELLPSTIKLNGSSWSLQKKTTCPNCNFHWECEMSVFFPGDSLYLNLKWHECNIIFSSSSPATWFLHCFQISLLLPCTLGWEEPADDD